MNLQELNYILCIAKHQNLTKASQELYVSQPTLTKHLQKLERDLDGKLFSRNGNSYTPTYLGRRYMEYAKKMLSVHQDWEKELLDLKSSTQGELNIAFPLMRSSCMIPKIMSVFHQKYPGIHVNIREEVYAIREKLLLDDQLDFGIFSEVAQHPGLSYELLAQEELLLVMHPDHPLTQHAVNKSGFCHPWIDLSLFGKENFILHFPEQSTGQLALNLFKEYAINPPVPIRTRNTETCVKLSQQGIGVCFIPETYIKNMYFEVPPACFSVGETGTFSTLSIAYRKSSYLPGYAQDFIQIAKNNI